MNRLNGIASEGMDPKKDPTKEDGGEKSLDEEFDWDDDEDEEFDEENDWDDDEDEENDWDDDEDEEFDEENDWDDDEDEELDEDDIDELIEDMDEEDEETVTDALQFNLYLLKKVKKRVAFLEKRLNKCGLQVAMRAYHN